MTRRRWLAVGAAAIVILAAGAAAAVILRMHEGRDVRGSSTVEFVPTIPVPVPVPVKPKKVRQPLAARVVWPAFGFDPSRLHVGWGLDVRPPFRQVWTAGGRSLIEFPPTIAFGRLYTSAGNGVVAAISTKTGRRVWAHRTDRCAAASPAVAPIAGGTVYVASLGKRPCKAKLPGDGQLVALSAATGKVRWTRNVGASETSPIVVGRTVYVGDWTGKVYAIEARTGHLRWAFQTGGAVKGGIAVSGGRVYAGSYDGHVYALSARTGRQLWRADSDPRLFGSSTFYSTPAVAYDRVYVGSTDGKVYSFGASTGKRRWSQGTGGYVYGSPAVWRLRVFVGSYDHTFYAFDAATGDIVWKFPANGPISGSASVIGGVVYFSTLRNHTYGLDARTGKLLWSFPHGNYAAAVADHRCLYVVGFSFVYAFEPRTASGPPGCG